ncbi:MAG: hypothetical protein IT290_00965 [Deltaproteobacteria bacterium]|nr:hypothetical protein [Deltaproteobacteria bacterium]
MSIRGACFLLGKAAALSAIVFALLAGESFREARQFRVPEVRLEADAQSDAGKGAETQQAYNTIGTRNLFGIKAAAPTAAPVQANTQQLKMRLVGTTIGRDGPIAIIEDLNKNEQEVFERNESLFGRAKLIDILADSAKLEYGGRQEILYIDEGTTGGQSEGGASGGEGDDETEFTVAESELAESLANLPLLLSQARAVPYFRNGQSIGMRLFAIRKDSMYEKLGLKNGDILTMVNDNNLSDPSQALKIFEQLKSERSINVKLERNGGEKNLHYSIR